MRTATTTMRAPLRLQPALSSSRAGRLPSVVVRADEGVSISPIARKSSRARQRQKRDAAAKLASQQQAAAPPATVSASSNGEHSASAQQEQQAPAGWLLTLLACHPDGTPAGVYPASSSNGVVYASTTSAQWESATSGAASSSGNSGSAAPSPISSGGNYEILEAFFYGRAFAITLSKCAHPGHHLLCGTICVGASLITEGLSVPCLYAWSRAAPAGG